MEIVWAVILIKLHRPVKLIERMSGDSMKRGIFHGKN